MAPPSVSRGVVALDDAADGLEDEGDVVELEVRTERPLRLRALDQPPDHRTDALTHLRVTCAAITRLDQLADTPVLEAQLERALEERPQSGPGIVSGRSDRQVDAIAENVVDTMKRRGISLIGREGNGNGRWTLLDFGDVVIHVFYHPVREFYDIESLWIDAPRVALQVPPEATRFQEETLFYDSP